MNHFLVRACAAAMGIAACSAGCDAGDATGSAATQPSSAARDAVAVVELFTSEGCSSCPPADELLSGIVADARRKDLPVYALEFHVDYWNRLGWVDHYSSPAYSHRQEAYAARIGGGQVYTPQMVVNGASAFIGSDRDEVRRHLDQALQSKARANIAITVERKDRTVSVRCRVSGSAPHAELCAAVLQSGITTEVRRGENGGKTLHHDNVVRAFQATPLNARHEASVELKLPSDFDPSHGSVIAFLQTPGLQIIGATAAALP